MSLLTIKQMDFITEKTVFIDNMFKFEAYTDIIKMFKIQFRVHEICEEIQW